MSAPSANMLVLSDLFRYNTWANARVFAACAALDASVLREDARGTVGTIEETLKHLVGVEDAFLATLRGLPLPRESTREAYLAHDLAWFAERAAEHGESYLHLLAGQPDSLLEGTMSMPWFKFPLTVRDGLLQVLTHAAQHRAQVLSTLGARGLEVPDIDYVYMVGGGGA